MKGDVSGFLVTCGQALKSKTLKGYLSGLESSEALLTRMPHPAEAEIMIPAKLPQIPVLLQDALNM